MKARQMLTVLIVVTMLAVTALADQAKEQKKKEAQLKTVKGQVMDSDENPIAAAVVYLKNKRTLAVKTYISNDQGNYRFSGLDPNVDYDLYASYKDKTSPTRTVSSYDTRKEITLHLKIKTKS